MAKSTCGLNVTYAITANTMHISVSVLDTGAGVNLTHASLIFSTWQNRIRCNSLSKSRNAKRQPLQLDGKIILHLRLRHLQTSVWFSNAPQLAVDTLLDTAFIKHFIRGSFPPKRKIEPWNSPQVAIFTSTQKQKEIQRIHHTDKLDNHKTDINNDRSQTASIVRAARQTALKSNAQHHVLVITISSEIVIIEPRALPATRQLTLAARRMTDIPTVLLFYMLVSIFSDREVRYPNHMRTAQTAEPHKRCQRNNYDDRKASSTGTPKRNLNLNRKTLSSLSSKKSGDFSSTSYDTGIKGYPNCKT